MRKVVLLAGEDSGDQLGAMLIEELRQRYPHAVFAGIAGPRMRELGCLPWHRSEELSVMGLFETLRHVPRLFKLRGRLIQRATAWRPDVVLGIDAPDFNLGAERILRNRGVCVAHWVSPTVWAWRAGRARSIAKACEMLLTLFPFEPAAYKDVPLDVRFCGHPLADRLPPTAAVGEAREQLGLSTDARVVAVLPGSRPGELARIGPAFAQTLQQLPAETLRICAPAASKHTQSMFRGMTRGLRIRHSIGDSALVLQAADVAMVASGTATLEAMLCDTPMVVGYRVHPLTFSIAKRVVSIRMIALPNILAGTAIIPELIQDDLQPKVMAGELMRLLDDAEAAARQRKLFATQRAELRQDAAARVADALTELVHG